MATDSSISALHRTLKEMAIAQEPNKSLVRSRLEDAFYNYQLGHCYRPVEIYVQDSYTGYLVKRMVNCGSCYYCRNNHINEWVTRCYAHLQDYKNAYFVTLTYSPYYHADSPLDNYMLNYLQDALFVYDDFNDRHRLGWNPCVLVKKHYQDFFKRLRRYTGLDDITYIIAGEYGSEFGRPHFHAIIFTNGVLSLNDIRRAWSVALVHHPDGTVSPKTNHKCPYMRACSDRKQSDFYWYHPIGRVDFHDLVANGTITQQKLLIEGRSMTGHDCFAYVCKYCNKQVAGNSARLSLAFDKLDYIYKLYEDEKISFTNDCVLNKVDELQRAYREKRIYDKVSQSRLFLTSADSLFQRAREEVRLVTLDAYPFNGRPALQILDPRFCYEPIYPRVYSDFVSVFGCFLCVSRGTPIGSLYVKTHLSEMVDGNFSQPPLQTIGYVVPKYFLDKVDEYIYSLRKVNVRGNATKGNLSLMQRLFDFDSDDVSILDCSISHSPFTTLDKLLNSSFCFVDKYTKERMLIWRCFRNSVTTYYVSSYKYDRSLRKYKFVRCLSLSRFCELYSRQLATAIARHSESESISTTNNLKKIQCKSYLSKILGSDYIKKIGRTKINFNNFDEFCTDAILRLEDNVKHHKEHIKLHKSTDKQ